MPMPGIDAPNPRPASFAASTARRGKAFGLSSGDADDYYDVVMSSEDEASDNDDTPDASGNVAGVPRDIHALAPAIANGDAPSDVMQPIASLGRGSTSTRAPTTRQMTPPQPNDEFKLTEEEIDRHSHRRTALEVALDAATGPRSGIHHDSGEAPFRFHAQQARMTSPAPSTSITQGALHGPEQSESAKKKRMPLGGIDEEAQGNGDANDPLYDDAMDDADEKWVQTNLRGKSSATDASLCCPCCFLTVAMDCQRHVRYQNQYRARVAINCRLDKEQVLVYKTSAAAMSDEAEQSTLPARGGDSLNKQFSAMTRREATTTRLLGVNEYFGVNCSDCGTTVGVYDSERYYHFFNVLPSNC